MGRKNWPDNLYANKRRDGRLYYYYRHPDTRNTFGLGYDFAIACEIALDSNKAIVGQNGKVALIAGQGEPFAPFVDKFETDYLPQRLVNGQPLSAVTLENYGYYLNDIRKAFKNETFQSMDLKKISGWLDAKKPDASNKHRFMLRMLYTYAIAKGLTERNLADATISRALSVTRLRLDLEGYRAVYTEASQWGRNAMDVALHSLQRRGDICLIKTSQIESGHLRLIQTKTQKWGSSAHLDIQIGDEFASVIARCRDGIASPYLVHYRPQRNKGREYMAKTKDHPTQLAPRQLSNMFKAARDASGHFDHLPMEQRPTFHEIRALGADLYREAGMDNKDIQRLLGHTTEKQTQVYLSRHAPRWTEVYAGLPGVKMD